MATLSETKATKSTWRYSEPSTSRDLRLDFIRGLVMFVLIVVHIEIFSWFNFLTWERIGVISGGEGFVILSGFVVGMVYGKKSEREGVGPVMPLLLKRSAQLYRINLFVICAIALVHALQFADLSVIMTWVDPVTKKVFPLYPGEGVPKHVAIAQFLLLKNGPHQLQILGLYVVLMGLAPLALWLLRRGYTGLLASLCWILYFKNWAFPTMPTGAQFEYAFPLLTWQLIFFHGMIAGFHRSKIEAWLTGSRRNVLVAVSSLLFVCFLLFTLNNPNPRLPDWAKLSWIPADIFYQLYGDYFRKNTLGVLRLVNYFVALVVGYAILTRFWKGLNRAFGWYLIPVGQASLYVFIVHIFFVWLIHALPLFDQENLWINTLGHGFALWSMWWMVKHRILFRWIPR